MAERTGHLIRKELQCPWCGERRLHMRRCFTIESQPVDGRPRYATMNRCISCEAVFPSILNRQPNAR